MVCPLLSGSDGILADPFSQSLIPPDYIPTPLSTNPETTLGRYTAALPQDC